MFNKFLPALFIVAATTGNLFAQTKIAERHYNMSLRDDNACHSYIFNITMPYLIGADGSSALVNDSIFTIVNYIHHYYDAERILPDFAFSDDEQPCDSFRLDLPDEITITYESGLNTADFLSLSISNQFIAGGGGGYDTYLSCFNINKKDDLFITIDSLFDPSSTKELINIINEGFNNESIEPPLLEDLGEEFSLFGKNESEELNYIGFSINEKMLDLFYEHGYVRGSGIVSIKVPLPQIKHLIRKNYQLIVN